MAELPSSWKLKTKRRADGRLEIIGKDLSGSDYKVRTCETGCVTDTDLAAIRNVDRESYSGYSQHEAAKRATASILAPAEQLKRDREDRLYDDLSADAEEIVSRSTSGGRATQLGQIDVGLTMGSTAAYRRGWEYAFGGND